MSALIKDLDARRQDISITASARAVEKQHPKGKLGVRERIELLVDRGSFVEIGEFIRHRCTDFGMGDNRPHGDGVVAGYATVDGRQVCLFAQDFTVFGGSMGEACGGKVRSVMELALKVGCPVIAINDSGGARIQEGVASLAYYAELGRLNSVASGVIPQISLIMGSCAGGAVYSPAITDFTVMVHKTSHMFVTGPDVVRSVTGEEVDFDDLGGATVNCEVAGNAHYLAGTERDAIDWVQTLLSYLPSNNLEPSPAYAAITRADIDAQDKELDTLVPDSAAEAYDMHEVIKRIVDEGELLEVQARFAPNVVCGFGRVDGKTVGVVANQPMHSAGTLDIDASEKASRFIRFCDAFSIPILTFVDVPGYMPGRDQERQGIIRRGAKLIYAYSEATVPKVTVVVRKAYGGGYAVMGSKHLGADINLAWPTAEIAVMGAAGAVSILHRKQLQAAAAAGNLETVRNRLIAEYQHTMATPYAAADRGYVDAVIAPRDTRRLVTSALRTLQTKQENLPPKKHSNMPL